jgi:hypothetical protein
VALEEFPVYLDAEFAKLVDVYAVFGAGGLFERAPERLSDRG